MNRTTISLLVSAAAVAGGTTWILINRSNKKKMLAKLMYDLETGNKSEDPTDIGILTKTGGALDPAMWRSAKPGTALYKTATATQEAKKLNGLIHGGFLGAADETGLIQYFASLKNQAMVSEIAEFYQKMYGIPLGDDLKTIDNTYLFGFNWGGVDMPKIMAAIVKLPVN